MKTRTDLLNHLAAKHNLKRYLEIGVQDVNQNFNNIQCELKRGVDPNQVGRPDKDGCVIIHTTSDDYFKQHSELFGNETYDLIFIDGLHTAEQVQKDFQNALKCLSTNGFIVLHDCNPLKEEHTIVPRPTERGHWNGDVYKFACELGLYFEKFNVVDIDNGCGVWNWAGMDIQKDSDGWDGTWNHFDQNRKKLLNLISWDEFIGTNPHL
jgi:hypothetical protein